MPDPKTLPPLMGNAAEREMSRLTRRSFTVGGLASLAGLGASRWLTTATPEDGIPWPLRRVLRFNQWLAEGYASPRRLAPTFPAESVRGEARTNGLVGLDGEVHVSSWRLRVRHEGRRGEQAIGLDDVQALPRTDLVT